MSKIIKNLGLFWPKNCRRSWTRNYNYWFCGWDRRWSLETVTANCHLRLGHRIRFSCPSKNQIKIIYLMHYIYSLILNFSFACHHGLGFVVIQSNGSQRKKKLLVKLNKIKNKRNEKKISWKKEETPIFF